jgi:formylglycine-generating enzyme required for sulfatase activity
MNFTIVSVVTLLSPNGGQILEAGTTTPITWSNEGTISNVKLEYSDDNGIDWTAIIASTPNDGTYSWTVPQLTSNQCLIRVSDAGDPAINDTSDTVFSAYVCQLNSIADLDTDCRVGIFELDLMTDNWLMSGSLADIVPPATVDFNDFAILAAEWLRVGNPFDVGYTEAPEGMAFIPSGQFQMGDSFSEGYSDELPVHAVYIDAFYMAKFETTNGQYCDYLNTALTQSLIEVRSGIVYAAPAGTDSYCNTNSSDSSSQIDYAGGVFTPMTKNSRGMSNDPAVCVSWFGATAYCNFNGYRLPTEAEWEYAARGGLAGKRYPWGDTIDGSMANYASSGDPYEVDPIPYTSPVGYYDGSQTPSEVDMANGYGLYDVTGNAWEWCNDWCDVNYYSISPYDNPTGPASSPDNWRILRGSSWSFSSADCRVAIRGVNTPDVRNSTCGFRTAKDIE